MVVVVQASVALMDCKTAVLAHGSQAMAAAKVVMTRLCTNLC
jgi:hypothetical protein